jgi:large subunit ribosomal protein L4
MAKVEIIDMERNVLSEKSLDDSVFGLETRPDLLQSVVIAQLAKRRSGTASTKTRSEVRGGGRKPWRQKGTGRARVGTLSSPILRGGGVTFGPKPRDYEKKVNKKVQRAALKNALSMKVQEGNLLVVDSISLDTPKTKDFLAKMEKLGVREALLIDTEPSNNLVLGSRNLRQYKILPQKVLNVYDLLCYETLVITEGALEIIEKRLGK